jgi:membrane associated rhomboid family serine protease
MPENFIIGSSSAIFGIIGSTLMREPLMKINLLLIFRIPIILVFGFIFLAQDLMNIFFTNLNLTSANLAHLFGFLTGVLITGIMYKSTIKTFYNWLGISFGFWMFINSI